YKKNPDGTRKKLSTWQVNFYYVDMVDGKKKKKHKRNFRTKKEGEKFEKEFREQHELKEGETPKADKAKPFTFEELVKKYRAAKSHTIRKHTWKTKNDIINSKILPYFKKMNLKYINSEDIDLWVNQLMKGPGDGTKYADTYMRTIFNQLSSLFNYAVDCGYIDKNPARGRAHFSKKSRKGINFWTLDEYKKFREAISENKKSYIAFEILYWCGIRVGELLALTPSDFDFKSPSDDEASKLRIDESYQRLNGEDVITAPKTEKSNRTITIPPAVAEKIENYIKKLYGIKPKERIFKFTKCKLGHDIKKYSEIAGVKKIRVHDLRHSHVSYLINVKHMDALAIADRMGHEAIDITYMYAHLFPNVQNKLAKEMDEDV
ncbi:MAG: site-specific integrase, partial [Oscillospiraceae bacterium]|nr:site-specific integrase [Oscillospiraceae bacterium]